MTLPGLAGQNWQRVLPRQRQKQDNSLVLPAALAFFHLALAPAESLARPAADIFLLPLVTALPFLFAHLAFMPAEILARARAESLRRFFRPKGTGISPPSPERASSWRSS